MAKMIDLGREYDTAPCCPPPSAKKCVSYPTLYISGVSGLKGLSTGELTFTAKGKVVSVSSREKVCDGKTTKEDCCEIEVHSIGFDSGEASSGGLGKALDKIAAKKADAEPDASDEGEGAEYE